MTPITKLNMVKALNLALLQEMERDPDVLILGEDVGVDGGVFRVTDDLQRKFGSQRVIDSPLAEAAIIGTAVGMALYGLKPVCEIQFSGFAFQCFHQIENHAARYRQRSQGRFHCQMVIRMPYGGGVRALEHHTESEEQFYAHVPGLKMVIPSGPRTARALLTSAIRDPDPVVFFESKALYHAAKEEIPEDPETLPIGRAQVVREGVDLTLVAYGAMLRVAREAADVLQAEDRVETEVIDLLTIAPLDRETIVTSVGKTGRAVSSTRRREASGPAPRSPRPSWRAPSSTSRRPCAASRRTTCRSSASRARRRISPTSRALSPPPARPSPSSRWPARSSCPTWARG